jgi:transcription factor C subunit 6
VGTGAWSPEVGIHCVTWNSGNGISNAHLLASATGSGLCRVDWLSGRWFRDRVPYYDIERMRGELGDMEIDEEEDEE